MPGPSRFERCMMTDAQPKPVNQKIRFWVVRLAFLASLPLIFLSQSAWAGSAVMHPLLKSLGALLIVAAVLYRGWAILYIGGRKNQSVVQDGPYSMSRHPLYFGTTLGAFGFGLLLGSIVLAVLFGALTLIIFTATSSGEERFLRAEFGDAYDRFAERVPNRILPRASGFQTPQTVTFNARILRTNFSDALGFLACFPIAEALEAMKLAGVLGRFAIY